MAEEKRKHKTSVYLVRHKLSFQDSDNYIAELEFIDVPCDAPKSERFSWILVVGSLSETIPLTFKSSSGNKREFEDGSTLDMDNLEYYRNNRRFLLERIR